MTRLPIRKLTLYKQGIGYYERRGEVDDSLITLVVPRRAINDALKSLTVMVHKGGQVLDVGYETPADRQKVLEELSIKVADRSSLVDLLVSLRGCRVTLDLGQQEGTGGRLIGVETSLDSEMHPASVVLQADEDASQVLVFPVNELRGFLLHDERSATDVGFFLDINRTEQARATLTVRLSEGKHDVEIGYLAPIPTWRVSYRLVGQGKGKARLVGWGLFDNQLDEDLNEVALTLISGRPITFEYGLYESYVPARPFVSDDPMAIEAISDNPAVVQALASITHEIRTPINSIIGFSKVLLQGISGALTDEQRRDIKTIHDSGEHLLRLINDLLQLARLKDEGSGRDDLAMYYASGPLGDLKVSGSYFKPVTAGKADPESLMYTVKQSVSVKRGHSAMVPIIDEVVGYELLCVYNGSKMPNHPLLIWRLRNTTGKVLEHGPVALTGDDRYLGEGIMHFTGVDEEVQIPYALEYGIRVRETTEHGQWELLGIEFDQEKKKAVVTTYILESYEYALTSQLPRQVTVFIEQRDPGAGEYFEMPPPDFTQAGHTRWAVALAPGAETLFTIRIRKVHERQQNVTEWNDEFIEEIRAAGLVSGANSDRLGRFVQERELAALTSQKVQTLEANYEQLVGRQEQLRMNLRALGDSGREVEIRNGVLDDLETSENRRRRLEQQIADLKEQIEKHERVQRTLVEEIYADG